MFNIEHIKLHCFQLNILQNFLINIECLIYERLPLIKQYSTGVRWVIEDLRK